MTPVFDFAWLHLWSYCVDLLAPTWVCPKCTSPHWVSHACWPTSTRLMPGGIVIAETWTTVDGGH
jgi:hypothetical protein